ncbi:MAG: sensor histidine kinase [Chryseotalea sp.]
MASFGIKWLSQHPIWVGVFLLSSVLSLLAWIFSTTGLESIYVSIAIQPQLLPLYVLASVIAFLVSDWLFIKKRYLLFFIAIGLLIYGMSMIANVLSPYTNSLAELNIFVHIISFFFVISFSLYLRIVKETIVRKQNYLEIKTKQQEAEIKALKQQLNPHFLFNTLNSLYLLALEKNEETPDMVLVLSDMLRYQIELNKSAKIELAKEIKFLDSYIYFQKRRAAARMKITFNHTNNFSGFHIVPSLLMVPIENAFTHGKTYVNINLTVDNNQLCMQVENVISEHHPHTTGTGLTNLRAQLHYFYPDTSDLKTYIKDDTIFCLTLKIKLN